MKNLQDCTSAYSSEIDTIFSPILNNIEVQCHPIIGHDPGINLKLDISQNQYHFLLCGPCPSLLPKKYKHWHVIQT